MAGYNLRTKPKVTGAKRRKPSAPKSMTPRPAPKQRLKVGQKPAGLAKPSGRRYVRPRQISGGTIVGLSGGAGGLRSVAEAGRQVFNTMVGPVAAGAGVGNLRNELSKAGVIKARAPRQVKKGPSKAKKLR